MALNFHIFLLLWLILNTQDVGSTGAGEDGVKKERRSDDPVPLATVVESLTNRLTQLEAKSTAEENEIAALKTQVASLQSQLANKRCESGSLFFTPFNQHDTITHGSDPHDTEKRHEQHVTFSHPFPSTPSVTAGITHLDTLHTANTRVRVDVANINTSGFDLTASQFYYDSVVYGVKVMWMACNAD